MTTSDSSPAENQGQTPATPADPGAEQPAATTESAPDAGGAYVPPGAAHQTHEQPAYEQQPTYDPAAGYAPPPGYGQTPPSGGQQQYAAPQPYGAQPYGTQPYAAAPQYGAPPPPAYAPPGPRTNALAIAALACSLAGFLTGITAIAGVICGHLALNQIRQTGEEGRGLAVAGIAIGYAIIALGILAVVAWILFVMLAIPAITVFSETAVTSL